MSPRSLSALSLALLAVASTGWMALASAAPIEGRLDNGLRTIIIEDAANPTVAASLWIKVGRAHNPRGAASLADLGAQLAVIRANQSLERDAAPPYLASQLSSDVTADYTRLDIQVLPEDLGTALRMLRATIDATDASSAVVPSLKATALRNLVRVRTTPSVVAHEALIAETCGDRRPLGFPTRFQELLGLGPEAVVDFVDRYYVAEAMVLTVTGRVDAEAIAVEARGLFGDLPAREQAAAPRASYPKTAPHPGLVLVDAPSADRAILLGGVATAGRDSDLYQGLQLLNVLLGYTGPSEALDQLVTGDARRPEYRVELQPSERGALLTVQAIVSHDAAVPALRGLQVGFTPRSFEGLTPEILERLRESRRRSQLTDASDRRAWLNRRVPFLPAGKPLERSGFWSDFDLGSWRDTILPFIEPDRQGWVLLGRARDLAPALDAAGLRYVRVDLHDVITDRLFVETKPLKIWEQDPPTALEVIQAENLLLLGLEAQGGVDRVESIRSYTEELTVYRTTGSSTLASNRQIRVAFPGRFREDWGMQLSGGPDQRLTLVQSVNENEVWRAQLGKPRPAPKWRARELRRRLWRDPLRILLRYGEPGTSIRLLEPELIGDTTAPGIELRAADETRIDLYFHPQSYLIVKRAFDEQERGGRKEVEEMFTDYRSVDGIYVPFRVAVSYDDKLAGEDHVDSLVLDTPFEPDLFERTEF